MSFTFAEFTIFLTAVSLLIAVLFIGGVAGAVVFRLWTGAINLRLLVAEADGKTSLSRFQMLLFTFVIASIYLVYALYAVKNGTVGDPPKLPEIPSGVLGLMGISGGSYVLAKGIQSAADSSSKGDVPIVGGERRNIS